jgi:hypothetical protein
METVAVVRDAAGNAVPHDRCDCGRHKQKADPVCCRECTWTPGDPFGHHSVACNLRQMLFSDTRRGCSVGQPARVLRIQRWPQHGREKRGRIRRGEIPG